MPRVKGGNVARKRRRKVLKLSKGYFGSKHTLYKTANEQVMKSMQYSYRDRRQRKRNFRKLWIARINAAARMNGLSYSKLINGLNLAGVAVNRKMLADLAVNDPKAFTDVAETAKQGLAGTLKPEVVAETKQTEKPKKAEAAPEPKEAAEEDLESLTVAELRERCKAAEITGYSTMKKAELIEALKK